MQRLETAGRAAERRGIVRAFEAKVVLAWARHTAQLEQLDDFDHGYRQVRRGGINQAHGREALRRRVVAACVHEVREGIRDRRLERLDILALLRGQSPELVLRLRLVLGNVICHERRREHDRLHRNQHIRRRG